MEDDLIGLMIAQAGKPGDHRVEGCIIANRGDGAGVDDKHLTVVDCNRRHGELVTERITFNQNGANPVCFDPGDLGWTAAPVAAFGDQHAAFVIESHHGRCGQTVHRDVDRETIWHSYVVGPDRPVSETGP